MIYTKMELKLKELKLRKIGGSYFIRIPMDYIKNEMVNPNKRYKGLLTIKEEE